MNGVVTLFGPHRDDLLFFVNERDVQTFGSQGQQRTTALSVKLAEIELIHSEIGEYPIFFWMMFYLNLMIIANHICLIRFKERFKRL